MLKFPSPFPAAIFVCTKEREPGHPKSSCCERGGKKLQKRLKKLVEKEGLEGQVRVFKSGCLGACQRGPVALAHPSGDLLLGITEDDLPAILDEIRPD